MEVIWIQLGSAAIVLAFGFGLPAFLNSLEFREEKKKAYDLISKALNAAKFEIVKKDMWFHPEGAGRTYLKVKLFLDNGKTLFFETSCSSGLGESQYTLLTDEGDVTFNEIRTRKTSRMIVNYFWNYQDRKYREAQEEKESRAMTHLQSF